MGVNACLNFANQAVDQQTEDRRCISLPGIHHTAFLCSKCDQKSETRFSGQTRFRSNNFSLCILQRPFRLQEFHYHCIKRICSQHHDHSEHVVPAKTKLNVPAPNLSGPRNAKVTGGAWPKCDSMTTNLLCLLCVNGNTIIMQFLSVLMKRAIKLLNDLNLRQNKQTQQQVKKNSQRKSFSK